MPLAKITVVVQDADFTERTTSMPEIRHSLVANGEHSNITVFVPDADFMESAQSDHPNFAEIVRLATAAALGEDIDPDDLIDLFDQSAAVQRAYAQLSERIVVEHGRVYFDGEEMHDALTEQILRVMDEDGDHMALVNFMEKLMGNPNPHSREQLYPWLRTAIERGQLTILSNGNFVGYKGVSDSLTSIHSGPAIVDGDLVNGYVPNLPGSVVKMHRDRVNSDSSVGCSVGLHVGTYDYATSFGRKVLEVHVDPADVVSVPTDSNAQKIRCCEYTVVREIEEAYSKATMTVNDSCGDDDCWCGGDGGDRPYAESTMTIDEYVRDYSDGSF